jgi:hypothetical protein
MYEKLRSLGKKEKKTINHSVSIPDTYIFGSIKHVAILKGLDG